MLVQAVTVTSDRRSAAEAAAERLPGLTADDVLDSPFLFIGTVPEMAAQALQWRERFGVSYFSVFEPAMRDFAPVIERLQGG